MERITEVISDIKEKLHQGDAVELNVKNLYDAYAKDGECKLKYCEVLNDNQYYDIATEHNHFAYGNGETCTVEMVNDDGSVLFCTNMTENKSDRFALSPEEVAIAYFGRKQEVTRCDRCGSLCLPTSFTPGYGIFNDEKTLCVKCCTIADGEALDKLTPGETYYLYLSKKRGENARSPTGPVLSRSHVTTTSRAGTTLQAPVRTSASPTTAENFLERSTARIPKSSM